MEDRGVIVWASKRKSVSIKKKTFSHSATKPMLINLLNDPWYRAIEANRPNYKCRRNGIRVQTAAKEGLDLHIAFLYSWERAMAMVDQVFMILEDQDESNGTTIVVQNLITVLVEYANPEYRKEAIALCPRAGDIVMWMVDYMEQSQIGGLKAV